MCIRDRTDLAVLNDHELDLNTTMMYRHEDYVTAIELVKEGKVQLVPLQSKVFPFGQYQQAYEYIDANRETTMKAVSYTHLAVYKRQACSSGSAGAGEGEDQNDRHLRQ